MTVVLQARWDAFYSMFTVSIMVAPPNVLMYCSLPQVATPHPKVSQNVMPRVSISGFCRAGVRPRSEPHGTGYVPIQ